MKKAVLVVSFGTSYKETREKTIEACEKKIREGLKDYEFFRAFTSNMIIRKLKNRDGLHIENPIEALDRLYEEGYKEVIGDTNSELDGLEGHLHSLSCGQRRVLLYLSSLYSESIFKVICHLTIKKKKPRKTLLTFWGYHNPIFLA